MDEQELTPVQEQSLAEGEQAQPAEIEDGAAVAAEIETAEAATPENDAALTAEAEAEAAALEEAARAEGMEPEAEEAAPEPIELPDAELKAILEAVVYVTEEPLEAKQMAVALGQKQDRVEAMLAELVADYAQSSRGLQIREIAGGYKMSTKPEHHEAVRQFVKNLKAPLKLTNAALETLSVVAYKQPITAPEIMEIRGVQGAGVLKTLLDRKLITTAGRKSVIGKPILYKTTKEFLLQFGLKGLSELPTLKEFEELRRLAFSDDEVIEDADGPASLFEANALEADATEANVPEANDAEANAAGPRAVEPAESESPANESATTAEEPVASPEAELAQSATAAAGSESGDTHEAEPGVDEPAPAATADTAPEA